MFGRTPPARSAPVESIEREGAALPALVERGLVVLDDRGHRAEAVHAAHVVGTVHGGTLCDPTTLNRRSGKSRFGGPMPTIAARLGEVGLPEPISALASRHWDAVVVGGGHNGLTCAAYLARAGKSVLVLERRDRLGGACTLERPFPDERYVVSPCAYVVGLLDQVVIDELDLKRRGLEVYVADPNLWAPFPDGGSFAQWLDDAKTQASLDAMGLSKHDIDGYWAYEHVFDEMRQRLRTRGRDTWIGESPTREELEALLGHDQWMIDILFDASISDVLDEYIDDQRTEGRALRPGRHRRVRRSTRLGHGVGEAHALPGRPRRARVPCGAT